jgi:signal transduction histidine kinase
VTTTPLLLRRLTTAQWQLIDAGLAVIVTLLCWYAAVEPTSPADNGWREPIWVTALAGLALGAPVAIRRSRPLVATALVLAASGLCLASSVIPDYASAAPIMAAGVVLYTVGASLPRRRSMVTALLAVVVFAEALVLAADSPFDPGAGQGTAFAALILGLSWALGWAARERRAYAAQLSRQATERAVDEERLRIAREMHDIVAHSMTVIAVKATIANHVADERPEEVRDALRVIETTSRTALTELRRTLGALRTDPKHAPAFGDPNLAPATDGHLAPASADHDPAPASGDHHLAPASGGRARSPGSGDHGLGPASGGHGVGPASGGHGVGPNSGDHGLGPASGGDGVGPASGDHRLAPASGDHRPRSASGDHDLASASGRSHPSPACGGPDLAPAPGIADLPSLVEAATSAGVEVQLDVRGVGDLPEGVGLAVFRIVQEALTNVVKHAGAAHCRVTVAGQPGAMVIEVVDDGRGEAGGRSGTEADGRGHGLIGMRERVALYRGELRAAPEPAGGWAVRARLDTAA